VTVILPDHHPAIAILKAEGADVLSRSEAAHVPGPRTRVALVNLMSEAIDTDTQFARSFSHASGLVEINSYTASTKLGKQRAAGLYNKDLEDAHRNAFMAPMGEIKNEDPDLVVFSGFNNRESLEKVDFIDEFKDLLHHIAAHNIPSLVTCWSGLAAMKIRHGIERVFFGGKLTGLFNAKAQTPHALTHGFNETSMPVSRYSGPDIEALRNNPELTELLGSEDAGPLLVAEKTGPFIYMFGHLEYLRDTLAKEYARDLESFRAGRCEKVFRPRNYFPANENDPLPYTWDTANRAFFSNLVRFANTRSYAAAVQPGHETAFEYAAQ
jgi:homoserine O-succinyltransferase/O-acetyltransferase